MSPDGVQCLITGGQTGVDRGALDAAIALGIPHGGWCPAGRRAEDGPIPLQYELRECNSPEYRVRTRLNVESADGTLILCAGDPAGGTRLTLELAIQSGRPYFKVDPQDTKSVASARDWLDTQQIRVLNVAGPRESTWPGAARLAETFMRQLLS